MRSPQLTIMVAAVVLLLALTNRRVIATVDRGVTIRGKVTHGALPLSNARVIAAVPAIDMRFADLHSPDIRLFEAKTDGSGAYTLAVELADHGPVEISLDARCEGYRSSAGTMMAGGDIIRRTVQSGDDLVANFDLRKALFVMGRVADEQGQAIPDVSISVTLHDSRGVAYVSVTKTDQDGKFRIYDVPLPCQMHRDCRIKFKKEGFVGTVVREVRSRALNCRVDLSITMDSGSAVTGFVYDQQGRPVSDVLVYSLPEQKDEDGTFGHKAARTNSHGRFELKGLPDGRYVIEALAHEISQKGRVPIEVPSLAAEIVVGLQPITASSVAKADEAASRRPFLGIVASDHPTGLMVGHLVPGGPADLAGLKTGDVIVEIAGRNVTKVPELTKVLSSLKVGDEVPIRIDSGRIVTIGLKSRPGVGRSRFPDLYAKVNESWVPRGEPIELFGMKLATVTPLLKERYGLNRAAGVVVLDPGPNPAKLGIGDIRAGDCFWLVGDDEIENTVNFVVQFMGRTSGGLASGSVRVVCSFRRVHTDGRWWTNTQYLRLDRDGLADLNRVYEQMCKD